MVQSASAVVTSLTKTLFGVRVQLSVAAGDKAKAAVIPSVLLHCNVWFNEAAVVVTTGAVLSITVIVWTKLAEVFPQPSVKFQVLTLT